MLMSRRSKDLKVIIAGKQHCWESVTQASPHNGVHPKSSPVGKRTKSSPLEENEIPKGGRVRREGGRRIRQGKACFPFKEERER